MHVRSGDGQCILTPISNDGKELITLFGLPALSAAEPHLKSIAFATVVVRLHEQEKESTSKQTKASKQKQASKRKQAQANKQAASKSKQAKASKRKQASASKQKHSGSSKQATSSK